MVQGRSRGARRETLEDRRRGREILLHRRRSQTRAAVRGSRCSDRRTARRYARTSPRNATRTRSGLWASCLSRQARTAATRSIARYAALQAFLRESKKFGSQRQLSEKRAVEIGMANLARTAGYKDPLRLSWAVETETFADFAEGRLTAVIDGVTLAVSVDEQGCPATERHSRRQGARGNPGQAAQRGRGQGLAGQGDRPTSPELPGQRIVGTGDDPR